MQRIRIAFVLAQLACAFGVGLAAAAWETKPFGTARAIRAVQFAGPDTGWAVGDSGTVLRTTNGGDSWTSLTLGTTLPLTRLHALNGKVAWVVGGEPSVYQLPGGTRLYQTRDGGATWSHYANDSAYHLVYRGESGEIAYQAYFPYRFNTLHFRTADTGWASSLIDVSATSYVAHVLKTVDGGRTWDSVLRVGAGGLMNPGEMQTRALMGNSAVLMLGVSSLTRTSHLGSDHVSTSHTCTGHRSVDLGKTWTSGTCEDIFPLVYPFGGSFVRNDTVWHAGSAYSTFNPQVSRSTNGGTTWLHQPGHHIPARSIHFLGSLGYAAGNSGSLVRTTDAGATWVGEHTGITANLLSVQIVSPTRAFALADDNTLRKGDPSAAVGIVSGKPSPRVSRIWGRRFEYTLPYAARVTITVRDAAGRERLRLRDAVEAPGSHAATLSLAALPAGNYVLDFRAGGLRESWPMAKNP